MIRSPLPILQKVCLLDLPVEILDYVFEFLEVGTAMICGSTCKYLNDVGRRHMFRVCVHFSYSLVRPLTVTMSRPPHCISTYLMITGEGWRRTNDLWSICYLWLRFRGISSLPNVTFFLVATISSRNCTTLSSQTGGDSIEKSGMANLFSPMLPSISPYIGLSTTC